MYQHFQRYLQQTEAPRSWTALEQRAPGAALVWVTWAEVWSAGVLACISPFTSNIAEAVDSMLRALRDTPPLLIGARTDLQRWTDVQLLSGWAATQLSLVRNQRLRRSLDADRGALTHYQALCTQLPASVSYAWKAEEWHTPGMLRSKIASALEHNNATPRQRGRPRQTRAFDMLSNAAEALRSVSDAFEAQEATKELGRVHKII